MPLYIVLGLIVMGLLWSLLQFLKKANLKELGQSLLRVFIFFSFFIMGVFILTGRFFNILPLIMLAIASLFFLPSFRRWFFKQPPPSKNKSNHHLPPQKEDTDHL
jgi:hypothetical protein